ncbi:hypothetical protein [Thioclava sp. SK-1]|uniref:hypothetical protein n=1 Tax=Thioclava sp. SK-1 TaxID=1889770 RepID=UPI00159EF538|nr:hypothetical protein [Thioclava sp. SK-1]
MTEKTTPPSDGAKPAKPNREERLRQALRANLQKRKSQARARKAAPQADGPEKKDA